MNKKKWLAGFESMYKGRIIEILSKGKREVARRSPGVRVIAVTDDNHFILTKELRTYLDKEVDIRLPGGKVVDTLVEYHSLLEKNGLHQAIMDAAKKELLEETGATAKTWTLFSASTSGGTIDWDLYYYIAKDLTFGVQRPEDDEKIEVLKLPLLEVIDIALSPNEMSEDRSRLKLLDYLMKYHTLEIAQKVRGLY